MAAALTYSGPQKRLIEASPSERIFLSGKSGCGKSTAAAERVRFLMEHTDAWPQILILTPGRNFNEPYQDLVSAEGIKPQLETYNGYIQKCLNLFWPLIAESTDFSNKHGYPMFLTIEAAQIIMAKLIREKRDEGYFNGLTASPSRVFNQVMVAMHKCAAAEIPFEDYAQIMKGSWGGDGALLPVFDQTLECGKLYREVCLKNNLLDYSLQLEIFTKYLLTRILPVYIIIEEGI